MRHASGAVARRRGRAPGRRGILVVMSLRLIAILFGAIVQAVALKCAYDFGNFDLVEQTDPAIISAAIKEGLGFGLIAGLIVGAVVCSPFLLVELIVLGKTSPAFWTDVLYDLIDR